MAILVGILLIPFVKTVATPTATSMWVNKNVSDRQYFCRFKLNINRMHGKAFSP